MTDKETMQMALNLLTYYQSSEWTYPGDHDETCEALRAALAKPKRGPLTDIHLGVLLFGVDPETKRLPPVLKRFAKAVEAAHGIKETE
jgi:hypothetical protein